MLLLVCLHLAKQIMKNCYNSGIGSNGLTSARHDIFDKSLAVEFPESFDNSIDPSLVYCGTNKIFDKLNGQTLGKLVLSPTRTYAPVVKEIFKFFRSHINGMIHCTGGGQTKILNFVDNLHIVKNNMFETHHYLNSLKKNPTQTGAKCIKFLTWVIEWRFMLLNYPMKSYYLNFIWLRCKSYWIC